jgi:hypothetical protein
MLWTSRHHVLEQKRPNSVAGCRNAQEKSRETVVRFIEMAGEA